MNWNQMLQAFNERYFSEDKEKEIYGRLAAMNTRDYQDEGEEDDHTALESLVEKIYRLSPMSHSKDRDADAKVRVSVKRYVA